MYITRYVGTIRLLAAPIAAGLAGQLSAAPLTAQVAMVGTQVRVTAPEHMQQACIGRVVASTDPLVVQEENGTTHYIPLRQIQLLEIRQQRRPAQQHDAEEDEQALPRERRQRALPLQLVDQVRSGDVNEAARGERKEQYDPLLRLLRHRANR
jgi:hypothetical protein